MQSLYRSICGAVCTRRFALVCAASASIAFGKLSSGALILNDLWADGSRAETNLPSESAVWAGVSASDGGSLSVAPGALKNVMGTTSRKNWTYFTSDLSAPNGSQPHNSVTSLGVGDKLTASITFSLPNGATSNAGNAARDFRFGLFYDPTDARVQTDANSDGGGAASPWADSTGYGVQIPLNSNVANTTNAFQIAKRTTSNTSLFGSSTALTNAPSGGTAFSVASNTSYTAQLSFNVISASQLDVTATILQGNTILSTQTVSDLGTSFGGTAIGSGLLSGSQGIYTNFDQLFFRMASNTETSEIDFSNFQVDLVTAPEPSSAMVLGLGALMMIRRRKRVISEG